MRPQTRLERMVGWVLDMVATGIETLAQPIIDLLRVHNQ
jgi:hypothetical protein